MLKQKVQFIGPHSARDIESYVNQALQNARDGGWAKIIPQLHYQYGNGFHTVMIILMKEHTDAT